MSQSPNESLLPQASSGGSPGGTKFKTCGDIPNETLAAFIDLLSRTYPMPSMGLTVEAANFAMGRCSVVQELIDERDKRVRHAEQRARDEMSGGTDA